MKNFNLTQLEELLNSLSEEEQTKIKGGNIIIEDDIIN